MLTQVVAFAKEVTALVADDYEIASEHAHSCAVMIGNKTKFKRGDDWYTWIDFPKFLTLFAESQKTGTSFSSLDYMARTPDWAIFGKGIPGDGGFNPAGDIHAPRLSGPNRLRDIARLQTAGHDHGHALPIL